MLPSRRDDVRDAGALLTDESKAEFEGWSFQRFDIEGNRRLMREARDSLLRSLDLRLFTGCCGEISNSSPGVHSGLGDTILDRDSWPVWCAQNGVSPDAKSAVVEWGFKLRKHTYA